MADCPGSKDCWKKGWCTARHGRCIAANDADCEQSVACDSGGKCVALDGKCVGTEPNSPTLMYVGIATVTAGIITTFVGGLARTGGVAWGPPYGLDEAQGRATMIVGVSLAGVGIPLMIAGAWEVPVEPHGRGQVAIVEPMVGPASAGVRVRF